jgi:hypothetical protein
METMNDIKTYTWKEYRDRFKSILHQKVPEAPYDNPNYYNYLKLNDSRQNRWLKKGVLTDGSKKAITKIKTKQEWIIITEPWCGDAAHSIAFLKLMADLNPLITVKFVWRDEPPFLIEHYLTNSGKSVPKLIVRNENGIDLFTWGPRPEPCQKLYYKLRDDNADFERMKIDLQQWYNQDQGKTLQNEMVELLK